MLSRWRPKPAQFIIPIIFTNKHSVCEWRFVLQVKPELCIIMFVFVLHPTENIMSCKPVFVYVWKDQYAPLFWCYYMSHTNINMVYDSIIRCITRSIFRSRKMYYLYYNRDNYVLFAYPLYMYNNIDTRSSHFPDNNIIIVWCANNIIVITMRRSSLMYWENMYDIILLFRKCYLWQSICSYE